MRSMTQSISWFGPALILSLGSLVPPAAEAGERDGPDLQELFVRGDTNEDGNIDFEEFFKMCNLSGYFLTSVKVLL